MIGLASSRVMFLSPSRVAQHVNNDFSPTSISPTSLLCQTIHVFSMSDPQFLVARSQDEQEDPRNLRCVRSRNSLLFCLAGKSARPVPFPHKTMCVGNLSSI